MLQRCGNIVVVLLWYCINVVILLESQFGNIGSVLQQYWISIIGPLCEYCDSIALVCHSSLVLLKWYYNLDVVV